MNIILVSLSLGVSRDSVILGSTVGPAIVQNVPHIVNKSIVYNRLTVAIEHTVSIHCKVDNISVQSTGDSSGAPHNTLVVVQATNPQQSNSVSAFQ